MLLEIDAHRLGTRPPAPLLSPQLLSPGARKNQWLSYKKRYGISEAPKAVYGCALTDKVRKQTVWN